MSFFNSKPDMTKNKMVTCLNIMHCRGLFFKKIAFHVQKLWEICVYNKMHLTHKHLHLELKKKSVLLTTDELHWGECPNVAKPQLKRS